MLNARWTGRIRTMLGILVVVGALAACGNSAAPGATPSPYGGY
jgi:hypothetical protein